MLPFPGMEMLQAFDPFGCILQVLHSLLEGLISFLSFEAFFFMKAFLCLAHNSYLRHLVTIYLRTGIWICKLTLPVCLKWSRKIIFGNLLSFAVFSSISICWRITQACTSTKIQYRQSSSPDIQALKHRWGLIFIHSLCNSCLSTTFHLQIRGDRFNCTAPYN